MKILILGVTGMLGSELFFHLTKTEQHIVHGTVRRTLLPPQIASYSNSIIRKVEASNFLKIQDIIHNGIHFSG